MRVLLVALSVAVFVTAVPALATQQSSDETGAASEAATETATETPTETPTEPPPTPPCEAAEGITPLGLDGVHEEFMPSVVPAVGHDILEEPYREEAVTRFVYRLDVSGAEANPYATMANVVFQLNWDNDTDFDFYVYDNTTGATMSDGHNGFDPLDGGGESASVARIEHCTDIRVDVVNYAGAAPTMTLDLKVGTLR